MQPSLGAESVQCVISVQKCQDHHVGCTLACCNLHVKSGTPICWLIFIHKMAEWWPLLACWITLIWNSFTLCTTFTTEGIWIPYWRVYWANPFWNHTFPHGRLTPNFLQGVCVLQIVCVTVVNIRDAMVSWIQAIWCYLWWQWSLFPKI